jgi:hypothetical protein
VQAKGICNIVNKMTAENFPNLKKTCPFGYREPPGQQIDLTKTDPNLSTTYYCC